MQGEYVKTWSNAALSAVGLIPIRPLPPGDGVSYVIGQQYYIFKNICVILHMYMCKKESRPDA